jgi:hypothetical protein
MDLLTSIQQPPAAPAVANPQPITSRATSIQQPLFLLLQILSHQHLELGRAFQVILCGNYKLLPKHLIRINHQHRQVSHHIQEKGKH